jgi:hypothetical protein
VVTTRFTTLEEAKSQRAFDRGWLPPVLPESARSIVESNNLDASKGTGSCRYDLSERSIYVGRLTQAGATLRVEQETDILTVTTNGSRWEIRLERNSDQARWSTHQL